MFPERESKNWFGVKVEGPNIKRGNFAAVKAACELYAGLRDAKVEGENLPKKGAALLVVAPHTYITDPLIVSWAVMKNAGRTPTFISRSDMVDGKLMPERIDVFDDLPY